jgi:hypothetical protein
MSCFELLSLSIVYNMLVYFEYYYEIKIVLTFRPNAEVNSKPEVAKSEVCNNKSSEETRVGLHNAWASVESRVQITCIKYSRVHYT